MSRAVAVVLALLGTQVLVANPAAAASAHVMISGYAYSPASLTVRAGDTVTWTNHDQAPHDVVTTSAPASFKSPMLSTGQSWSHTFTKAGSYSYYCSVHPDMKAAVAAQQAAAQPTTPKPQPAPTSKQPAATTQAPATSTPETTTDQAPPPVVDQAPPPVQQQALPATEPSLDPMLLVAGVVAAVAMLCLLLLGSRRQD